MKALNIIVTLSTVVAVSYGHVAANKTPNELHPVHELYVKPSADGTTGDLYVAATEDSGTKTQWLTDQPVHFLPVQTPALTTNYEESLASKNTIANPHIHYAYAIPTGKPETNAIPTYPYAAVPTASPTPSTEAKPESSPAAAYPHYSPYHFFYPQMMAAYANMMSVLKDSGMSDESATSAMSHGPSFWPHTYPYYPYQYPYVMVDPNAWAHAQTTTAPATPTTPATADKD